MTRSGDSTRRKSHNHGRKRFLGIVVERLVPGLLHQAGFTDVRDLNAEKANHPFADYSAVKDGVRYAISVKGRNRNEWDGTRENRRYKLGKVSPCVDGLPHCRTLAFNACAAIEAVGAWIIVRVGPETFDAYFGTLEQLDAMPRRGQGPATAIPVNEEAIRGYMVLASGSPHGLSPTEFRNYDEVA